MSTVEYREAVARSCRSTVPSEWYLKDSLAGSDRKAIEIALDELESYIGVMGEDTNDAAEEAHLEKLRWASRKLHNLLEGRS